MKRSLEDDSNYLRRKWHRVAALAEAQADIFGYMAGTPVENIIEYAVEETSDDDI